MPRRNSRSTARRSRRAVARPRRLLLKWALGLVLLGGLALGGYSLHLAQDVRVKFEGKRWAVPARVYARPLELYVGAPVSAEQLAAELDELGYRQVPSPERAAQWSRKGGRFLLRTRPFRFWDEDAPAAYLEVQIADGAVTRLRDAASGTDIDLARLEPAPVGSIYPAHNEDRVLVQRAEIPDHLVQALLAVEDRQFYHHPGIDVRAVARAVWSNLRAGRTVQGGSTLTQQLVKNFFLTPERSWWRKFNEALMALILEARYDKDEILEAYANEIFLGQDGERAVHGFGLAAYFYFNRPLQELSLPETAMLVGLVKGASYYNPRRNPERAKSRRDLVLDQMAELGMLDAATLTRAKAMPLGVGVQGRHSDHRYPAFVDLVRRQLQRDYREDDLTSEGLRIFSTLDPWAQRAAQRLLDEQLARLDRKQEGQLQGAVVLVGAQGGEVRAVVGGRANAIAGFNRALDAIRPIGSLVKPAVYLTALARPERYSLLTLLDDTAVALKLPNGQTWKPQNFDRKEHGMVPLHQALAQSYNLATVRLGLDLGLREVAGTLQALGIERDIPPLPSLLLGAVSVSPLEVAQVYQTLASGGYRSPLRAIREVLTGDGQPLQRYPLTVSRVADPGPVFLLSRNLVEVVREGTGRGLASHLGEGREVAGKTGTTNDLRDSWFAGFSGDQVGVVWIGRDDNGSTGLTGSTGALPVWGRLMRALRVEPLQLNAPDDIDYSWVLPDTGLLADQGCDGAVSFPFLRGHAPRVRSSCVEREPTQGVGRFFERLFQ